MSTKPERHASSGWRQRSLALVLPVVGLLGLLWFLLRVVPKPSRATYPCQRVAFPLASSFVIWLVGLIAFLASCRRARYYWARTRYAPFVAALAVSVGALWLAHSTNSDPATAEVVLTPNAPIGAAKGAHPGRVVWAHDPDATDWDGPGNGHWWEPAHTSQGQVDRMMDRALRALAGESKSELAWGKLFRHFNGIHGRGKVPYKVGEKVAVKVNFVGCIKAWDRRKVTKIEQYKLRNSDYMNTSPQMIIALLRQLRDKAGVRESDITVGDTLCYFPNEYYELCQKEFPNVRYLDYVGEFGRTRATRSSVPLYWSTPDAAGKETDYLPVSFVQASYLINMANLKSHNDFAGITLCAKNHYGSLVRTPTRKGYFNMHNDLPFVKPGMGRYRPLVDLMGHEHLGGKTLLFIIDGLYAGKHAKERAPRKWKSPPFNGDWSSSLFVSQDPVAIDAVGFDFLRTEWDDAPQRSGTNDYLIEAAMANNPPSATFYDPNHGGQVARLESLGVYENWNNAQNKQYSRNLGTGGGIELVKVTGTKVQ